MNGNVRTVSLADGQLSECDYKTGMCLVCLFFLSLFKSLVFQFGSRTFIWHWQFHLSALHPALYWLGELWPTCCPNKSKCRRKRKNSRTEVKSEKRHFSHAQKQREHEEKSQKLECRESKLTQGLMECDAGFWGKASQSLNIKSLSALNLKHHALE